MPLKRFFDSPAVLLPWVLVLLLLFLGNLRAALVVAVTLPLAALVTSS